MKKRLIASLRIGLAAFVMLFATNLVPVLITTVHATTGNNGTLKVHEYGTPDKTENNDPKVCAFNLEGFGLDVGQTGHLIFEVQGGDGPTGTSAGPFEFGPTATAATHISYAASQNFNTPGDVVIQNGHYKVTLFGKDLPNGTLDNVKAESKVFKVDCTPTAPTANAQIVACVNGSGATDKVSVLVTNTADGTHASVTYSVVLSEQTKSITLADGATGNVEFGGLAVGSYTAVVTGTDGTVTTNSVTVKLCAVTPPTPLTPAFTADVTFGQPTCENTNGGNYTIPNALGVQYKVSLNGGAATNVAAGTYSALVGTKVVVTAVAKPDFMLTGNATWQTTIAAADECVLGDNDVCPNITGSQTTVPITMIKDTQGNCITPGLGGGDTGGSVLGISTVVAAPGAKTPAQPELVNTGQNSLKDMIVGMTVIAIALTTAGLARRRQVA